MKYKLVYIEWEDANSMAEWQHNNEIDDWLKINRDCGEIRQIGWLIRQTKTCLIIASRHAPENDYQEEGWGCLQKIPKTWIKKRKVLKI